jgi:hypothetical protein
MDYMRNIIWMGAFVLICAGAKGQNVGIGTELPNGLLHLHGGSNANTNLIFSNNISGQNNLNNSMMVSFSRIANIANSYGQIYVPQDIRFWIRQGDNYPFYIASNGAVGIGTSNPTARLQVFGGNAIIENALNSNSSLLLRSGTNNGLSIETVSNGTNTTSKIRPVQGGGAFRGLTLRWNSYFGLGVLDLPQYPMHFHASRDVVSDVLSTSGIAFTHQDYGENPENGLRIGMRVGADDNEKFSFIANRANEDFFFFQGGNTRMRIGTNGNVAIGNHLPNASAALDIAANNKGILIPRMTNAQKNAIANPATGLLVYRTDGLGAFEHYTGTNWMTLNSQLELITQNNISGWRLRVSNANNYGNIGVAAVDLSQPDGPGNTFGATGGFSFASGRNTTASGSNAVAMGFNTLAGGSGSAALGNSTKATGISAMAFGSGTEATGNESTVFGLQSKASSKVSTAFGFQTTASNFAATAFGNKTIASGHSATAFGENTTASGSSSIAFGNGATASEMTSTAFGINTRANGVSSTAFGTATTASAQNSTAFGANAVASANNSSAFGEHTTASSFNSLVIGRYNVIPAFASANTWIGTDPLFVIGNGTSSVNQSNAVTVLKNGNTGIGLTAPSTKLHIQGGNWNLATTDGDLLIGGGSSNAKLKFSMSVDGGGVGIARINSAGGFASQSLRLGVNNEDHIVINSNGHLLPFNNATQNLGSSTARFNTVFATNGTINTSDARLKTNVENLSYGLAEIMALNPVKFQWKDVQDGRTKLGLMAQDLQKLIPEVVVGSDADQLGVYYADLIPVLIKALQEQQATIDALSQKLKKIIHP